MEANSLTSHYDVTNFIEKFIENEAKASFQPSRLKKFLKWAAFAYIAYSFLNP